jgi:membrane-associated phospholipid phosphatase
LPALRRRLGLFVVLALLFVIFTALVASGSLASYDHSISDTFARAWQPALEPLLRGVAMLAGLELTALLMIGLAIYLRRSGLLAEAWVVLVYPVAVLLEFVYKRLVHHPEPPASHPDGPSLTMLLERSATQNSFPSGHMTRAVLVYGLLAFVVYRLSPNRLVRRLTLPVTLALILVEAFDRLYLEVHWQSDVIGGVLLGATCLAAAIIWLDAPRRRAG